MVQGREPWGGNPNQGGGHSQRQWGGSHQEGQNERQWGGTPLEGQEGRQWGGTPQGGNPPSGNSHEGAPHGYPPPWQNGGQAHEFPQEVFEEPYEQGRYSNPQQGQNQHNQGYPQQEQGTVQEGKPKKKGGWTVQTILATVLVSLVVVGGMLYGIRFLTGGRSTMNTDALSSSSSLVEASSSETSSSEADSSEGSRIMDSVSSGAGTTTRSSSSTSRDLGSSTVETYSVNAVSNEVLQTTGLVEDITLQAENDLLAVYQVRMSVGSTTLTAVLNYEQARGLRVGDTVQLEYAKVEGADKVVLVSLTK